jgi:hypothetical protein
LLQQSKKRPAQNLAVCLVYNPVDALLLEPDQVDEMRTEFLEVETMQEAHALAPWAAKIVEVEGGYMAFESMTDYEHLVEPSVGTSHPCVRVASASKDQIDPLKWNISPVRASGIGIPRYVVTPTNIWQDQLAIVRVKKMLTFSQDARASFGPSHS